MWWFWNCVIYFCSRTILLYKFCNLNRKQSFFIFVLISFAKSLFFGGEIFFLSLNETYFWEKFLDEIYKRMKGSQSRLWDRRDLVTRHQKDEEEEMVFEWKFLDEICNMDEFLDECLGYRLDFRQAGQFWAAATP
jgi:hypothetical protein